MPPFVYLVPILILFGSNRFTAIVAGIVYAAPAAIKLVADGVRGVSPTTIEAAESSGTSRWQMITKVQLPMARGSLLLGANQGLLYVLSMVVIGGMVGAGALGFDVVSGFRQANNIGRGLAAGICDCVARHHARPDHDVRRSKQGLSRLGKHRPAHIGLKAVTALGAGLEASVCTRIQELIRLAVWTRKKEHMKRTRTYAASVLVALAAAAVLSGCGGDCIDDAGSDARRSRGLRRRSTWRSTTGWATRPTLTSSGRSRPRPSWAAPWTTRTSTSRCRGRASAPARSTS